MKNIFLLFSLFYTESSKQIFYLIFYFFVIIEHWNVELAMVGTYLQAGL